MRASLIELDDTAKIESNEENLLFISLSFSNHIIFLLYF